MNDASGAGSHSVLPESKGSERFRHALSEWQETTGQIGQPFFDPQRSVTVAHAPGRLDVMGGIADYSGSLVLQMPLRQATFVAVQADEQKTIRVTSLGSDAGRLPRTFQLPLDQLRDLQARGYSAAQQLFAEQAANRWAAYPLGVVLVLATEDRLKLDHGWRILIYSDVPEGKGVSSSAALEVATLRAFAGDFIPPLGSSLSARYCQLAENLVVGAPCGIMDQMTSAIGRSGQLLSLLCQPADIQGYVAIPPDLDVWGIDSGIQHAVSGSDYTEVRTGAFMGYRIIADLVGLEVELVEGQDVVSVSDDRWNGYLANITIEQWERELRDRVPETLCGADFLEQYHGTTDLVTHVDRSRVYAVRQPTAHPIYEHDRVQRFARLMSEPPTEKRLQELGALMRQSHASYSACGLGSEGTDQLCRLVEQIGCGQGLYGAKITGGGSGGTVAILGRRGADDVIRRIADRYYAQSGRRPFVFLNG